jgi:uncharacterized cupredoxin-like copper-binding protein
MSHPTDPHETRRELRSAGWLFAALAAVFVAVTGTTIAVASARIPDGTEAAMAAAPAAEPAERATTPTTAAAEPSDPNAIRVRLGEFFFAPKKLSVPAGKPVTFFVTNPGVVDHELVIGDAHAQDEAEAAMRSGAGHTAHGNAGHHADEVPAIYLRPGESGELTVTLPENGELLIGCHVPGHWAAGMRGTLEIG